VPSGPKEAGDVRDLFRAIRELSYSCASFLVLSLVAQKRLLSSPTFCWPMQDTTPPVLQVVALKRTLFNSTSC